MKLSLVSLAAVLLLKDLAFALRPVTPGLCPNGSFEAKCKAVPCLVVVCPEFPEAKCVSNYCGGCNAKFYLNNIEVTSNCSDTKQPGLCNDGSEPFKCLVEPCAVTNCPNHPEAKCVDETCGGCRARFYVRGMEVTDACSGCNSVPVNQCPQAERVTCIIRPCDTRITSCTNIPEATCYDDYCKGCNARWFLPDCSEVTSKCEKKTQ